MTTSFPPLFLDFTKDSEEEENTLEFKYNYDFQFGNPEYDYSILYSSSSSSFVNPQQPFPLFFPIYSPSFSEDELIFRVPTASLEKINNPLSSYLSSSIIFHSEFFTNFSQLSFFRLTLTKEEEKKENDHHHHQQTPTSGKSRGKFDIDFEEWLKGFETYIHLLIFSKLDHIPEIQHSFYFLLPFVEPQTSSSIIVSGHKEKLPVAIQELEIELQTYVSEEEESEKDFYITGNTFLQLRGIYIWNHSIWTEFRILDFQNSSSHLPFIHFKQKTSPPLPIFALPKLQRSIVHENTNTSFSSSHLLSISPKAKKQQRISQQQQEKQEQQQKLSSDQSISLRSQNYLFYKLQLQLLIESKEFIEQAFQKYILAQKIHIEQQIDCSFPTFDDIIQNVLLNSHD